MDKKLISNFLSAARLGDVRSLTLFLDKRMDVNSRDVYGYTALSEAITENQYDSVKFLIEHNADVNIIYENKYNVLHIATGYSEIDERIVEILLPKIKDINAQDKPHLNTALWYACHFGFRNEYKIAEILFKYGAIADIKNIYGKSVRDIVEQRNVSKLTQLIERYAHQ